MGDLRSENLSLLPVTSRLLLMMFFNRHDLWTMRILSATTLAEVFAD